jgi:hypothetical protein
VKRKLTRFVSVYRRSDREHSKLKIVATASTFGYAYEVTNWPIVLAMDDDRCEVIGEMLGRGSRSIRRKPAPLQLCPPQNPHDRPQAGTRTAAMGSRE